jgi:hypothetical protein
MKFHQKDFLIGTNSSWNFMSKKTTEKNSKLTRFLQNNEIPSNSRLFENTI